MNAQFIFDHILRGEAKIQELEKELEEERNNHTVQLERIQKLEAEKAENENTINRLTREKEELVEALRKAKDGSKVTPSDKTASCSHCVPSSATVDNKEETIPPAVPHDTDMFVTNIEEEPVEPASKQEEGKGNEKIQPIPDLFNAEEEKGEVVFMNICKLSRYSIEREELHDWANGKIEILKNLKDGSYRVIVWQDQTEKVIANFKLTNWMSIDQIPYASCIWKCNDFSTGTPKMEIIMARFYSVIAVNEFVKRFKEGVRIDAALQKSGEELIYPENEVRGVMPHSKKGFRGKVPTSA